MSTSSSLNLTLLLGDMARVAEGKLDILGAGWTFTHVPVNLGVGLLVEVPWAALGETYRIEVVLQTGEGDLVVDDTGEPVVKVGAELTPQRPPGVVLGLPATACVAWNRLGVYLDPGRQYRLQASVNGEDDPSAGVTFSTVSPAGPSGQVAV